MNSSMSLVVALVDPNTFSEVQPIFTDFQITIVCSLSNDKMYGNKTLSKTSESFELTFRPADVDLSTCTNLVHQQPWQKFRHFISKLGGGDLVRQ